MLGVDHVVVGSLLQAQAEFLDALLDDGGPSDQGRACDPFVDDDLRGTQDEMVALPRATASRDALQALGYAVEWHDYPMGHSVCMEEVQDLRHWLLRVLAAPAD